MRPDAEKTKPKLIFVWNYVEWGGSQVYMLSIMKVARAKWDIRVLLPRRSDQAFLTFLDQYEIKYQFIENALDLRSVSGLFGKVSRQFQRLRTEFEVFTALRKYDLKRSVVHTDLAPWQSWILISALCLSGARLFSTMHNIMPRTSAWREIIWRSRLKVVSKLSRFRIFASNNDTKNRLKGWVSDEFWNKIKVTYTAVDPKQIEAATSAEYDRYAVREKFGIRRDRFIVLCVGNFIDRKGRWQYLDAAKIITAKRDDIDLVWLTPNLPKGADLERVEGFGLGDRLKIIRSADVGSERHSVLAFFRVADAFALPSLIEGLPIALLEAMAMGLPSISTNINAIPEAIFNEDTGLLIEPDDSVALATAIEKLADDKQLRELLTKNGREYALANFDETKIAADVIASYSEALTWK
ncbi:MAG TPA: glycosyltransferase family 4 protein [Sphingorhabdus sp.]|nr:glycosyltransferase family 4 protein [Sphingorhabdus sp.]